MNKTSAKILIIDDNEDVLLSAKLLLKSFANVIHTEKDPSVIPNLLQKETYDVIFLDMNFTQDMTSGQEGFYWLTEIQKIDPLAVVILITAFGDVEMAVKALKNGAVDFVLKPWQNEKFIATFTSALELRKSRLELENLQSVQKQLSTDIDKSFHDFIGDSPEIKQIFKTIKKVAVTDANVLILGENGTGKELVARALHRQSDRKDKPFIKVDIASIHTSLFESELFGHIKGAFTDAKENRAGRFEIADGGTLFLDEIGNLPIDMQIKLLTVLENREVARVGSNKYKSIDIKLICATNMDLHKIISENKFRKDLFYRINTVEITIPPLRERVEDIPLLAEYFLRIYKKKYNKPELGLSPFAIEKLQNFHWPGNVRELKHTIEKSVILSERNILLPNDFILSASEQETDNLNFNNYNLEETEKNIIKKVLKSCNGNITKAAKQLGLTRTSLYRRMEKYNL